MNIEKNFLRSNPFSKKTKEIQKARKELPFLLFLFGGDYERLKSKVYDIAQLYVEGRKDLPSEGSNPFLKMIVEGLDNLRLEGDDFAKLKGEIMKFYYKQKAIAKKIKELEEEREKMQKEAKLKMMVRDARLNQLRERRREGIPPEDIDPYSGEVIEDDDDDD